jgi:hypothetical protein
MYGITCPDGKFNLERQELVPNSPSVYIHSPVFDKSKEVTDNWVVASFKALSQLTNDCRSRVLDNTCTSSVTGSSSIGPTSAAQISFSVVVRFPGEAIVMF